MRIALDATYSLGENLSGVGVYSREIIAGLAAAHPEAELLLCYRPHRFLRSFSERLPHNCRRRLLHEPFGPRSAALFHGMNQRLPKLRLRRAVSTFHDLFVLTGDYSTPEFRRRFEAQARDAAARSDLVITVSEFTASQVEQLLGVERSRLRVVHHGVKVPAMPAQPAARRNVVLHVGAIQKRKNISRLVKAFAALPPGWRLILAGSFGYGADEILREIENSPRRADIILPGYVSEAELASLYAQASIFAFPSLDEGFGMPVLEAMAWGIPVLTSNRSALPEVSGGAAMLVDPFDVDAIAAGLVELASNEDLREELRNRGKARVACFSWENAASRTWSAYLELLNRH
ncbi:MAG TPA: glycosyltransferase family 1 protein [Bryobacteraceae bacterium]|nr:glycosyltransferase family 1 protein [Bryobacteraceae bacterium]HOQ47069.1 glycosyltransferase family 1 protein [Bryobacteraceae bacterium]HPQ15243.1 glycosyltransferase family 1 protein [Bryobacteraceae bacterium]HPU71058.1 glycosyltransferase family 1 protein [Bryobacteraceae bacterium]